MSSIILNEFTSCLDYRRWFARFAKKHGLIGGDDILIHCKMFKPILLSEKGEKYKQILKESDLSAFFKCRFYNNDQLFDRLYRSKVDFLQQLFKNI